MEEKLRVSRLIWSSLASWVECYKRCSASFTLVNFGTFFGAIILYRIFYTFEYLFFPIESFLESAVTFVICPPFVLRLS